MYITIKYATLEREWLCLQWLFSVMRLDPLQDWTDCCSSSSWDRHRGRMNAWNRHHFIRPHTLKTVPDRMANCHGHDRDRLPRPAKNRAMPEAAETDTDDVARTAMISIAAPSTFKAQKSRVPLSSSLSPPQSLSTPSQRRFRAPQRSANRRSAATRIAERGARGQAQRRQRRGARPLSVGQNERSVYLPSCRTADPLSPALSPSPSPHRRNSRDDGRLRWASSKSKASSSSSSSSSL